MSAVQSVNGNALIKQVAGASAFPTTNPESILYANGQFVVMGDNATVKIAVSTDGVSWSSLPTAVPPPALIRALTYGNGLYVAAGSGKIYTSTDLLTWVQRSHPLNTTGNPFTGLAFGGGVFVATVNNGGICTSTDGINWTARTSAAGIILAVTYAEAQGMFVTSGSQPRITTSPDGVTWTSRSFSAIDFTGLACIAAGGGAIVAMGTNKVWRSTDGTTWASQVVTEGRWSGCVYHINKFVAVNPNSTYPPTLATSPDGITWTTTSNEYPQGRRIASSGSVLVAIGTFDAGCRIISSSDGATSWTPVQTSLEQQWREVIYAQSKYVALAFDGYRPVATSSDGFTWTSHRVPYYYSSGTRTRLASIAYGNGTFVAVSQRPEFPQAYTSPDAVTWTANAASHATFWTFVVFGNSRFLAVRNSLIQTEPSLMYSSNGVTWTNVIYGGGPNMDVTEVKFLNGFFIMLTKNPSTGLAHVFKSSDGVSWSSVTIGSEPGFISVTYGLGNYYLMGEGDTPPVYTSPDATTWTFLTTIAELTNEFSLYELNYTGRHFYLSATSGSPNYVSFNCVNWTAHTSITGLACPRPRETLMFNSTSSLLLKEM